MLQDYTFLYVTTKTEKPGKTPNNSAMPGKY